MFSGIIEELGKIKDISKRGDINLITVEADKVLKDTELGDSISVNGVCLTVVKKESGLLSFEVIPQTLKITNLKSLRTCDKVNLERSLRVGDRVSGHFVSGHIDCVGIIRKKNYINGNLCYQIQVPLEFISYCIPRGSIAVDGISLTIADKQSNTFSVYLIPHTLKNTTLGLKGPSRPVNVEFDLLAKKGGGSR